MKKLKERFLNFYHTTYGMLITVSWVVLIACLIIKLFGGNWFALGSDNSRFNNFCNFVENTQWLKMILACIIAIITTYPVYCVMLKEKYLSKKHFLILVPLIIIKSIISWYSAITSFIIDMLIIFVIPIFITKNWKRPLICGIIVMVFQLLMIAIRSLTFNFFGNTFVEQFLYQIDYYLMIWLFYLYTFNTKKVEEREGV